MFNLTSFQIHVLAVICSSGEPHGLAIKKTVQDEYNHHIGDETEGKIEVNHGRLYPNLNELAEKGYLEKGEIDRRTNYYKATESAYDLVGRYADWLNYQLDTDTVTT